MKDWQVTTVNILNTLDTPIRIKLVMYIMQSDFICDTNSCIDTFDWDITDEGYKYWYKLCGTHSIFPHKIKTTEIQKFVQSLYPRETYPEYYI